MSHIVKLTVKGRNDVIKYAHNLPSTLGTYFNFDAFLSLFEFTPEEQEQYEIRFEDGEIKCNCPDKVFEIDTYALSKTTISPARIGAHSAHAIFGSESLARFTMAKFGNNDFKSRSKSIFAAAFCWLCLAQFIHFAISWIVVESTT